MYRRRDSDIFGAKAEVVHPVIKNQSYVDPHSAFRTTADRNYELYTSKLTGVKQTITKRASDWGMVNENADFSEDFHKSRKQKDLQSSIFYPPSEYTRRPCQDIQNIENNPFISNRSVISENHGRKQTMKREINGLLFNCGQFKGNESRLFDMDERMSVQSEVSHMTPLIPYGMQWDQHDSVKYPHINVKEESKSKYGLFEKEEIVEEKEEPVMAKKQEVPVFTKNEVRQTSKVDNGIEVRVLKGWNPKLMQGLAKHCKLNKSAILQFTSEGQKATITLKRSDRWQNVTDWLRKDCKLKLRIMN